jgi:hypothetical protein
MTKKAIEAFRNGDVSMLTFAETVALKEVIEHTAISKA